MNFILNWASFKNRAFLVLKRWSSREWNTWPVLPLLLVGALVSLIVSAVIKDWTIVQAWAMTTGFVLAGTFLLYLVQAPLSAPVYQAKKRRVYLFGMASAFSFRWILLGVPLFIAALNPHFFSVATAAACALITPLLLVGSSLALYFKRSLKRSRDDDKQHGPT